MHATHSSSPPGPFPAQSPVVASPKYCTIPACDHVVYPRTQPASTHQNREPSRGLFLSILAVQILLLCWSLSLRIPPCLLRPTESRPSPPPPPPPFRLPLCVGISNHTRLSRYTPLPSSPFPTTSPTHTHTPPPSRLHRACDVSFPLCPCSSQQGEWMLLVLHLHPLSSSLCVCLTCFSTWKHLRDLETLCACICACVRACMYVCTCVCVSMCLCMCVCRCICTCVQHSSYLSYMPALRHPPYPMPWSWTGDWVTCAQESIYAPLPRHFVPCLAAPMYMYSMIDIPRCVCLARLHLALIEQILVFAHESVRLLPRTRYSLYVMLLTALCVWPAGRQEGHFGAPGDTCIDVLHAEDRRSHRLGS
jgi:hypothetical protein